MAGIAYLIKFKYILEGMGASKCKRLAISFTGKDN